MLDLSLVAQMGTGCAGALGTRSVPSRVPIHMLCLVKGMLPRTSPSARRRRRRRRRCRRRPARPPSIPSTPSAPSTPSVSLCAVLAPGEPFPPFISQLVDGLLPTADVPNARIVLRVCRYTSSFLQVGPLTFLLQSSPLLTSSSLSYSS